MKELYCIIGTGTAPKEVIEASLNDLGTKVEYMLPWYGKPTEGLETVYDWMLDNEATYTLVSMKDVKVPNALIKGGTHYPTSGDVDNYILETAQYRDVRGTVLVLWDEDRAEDTIERCIKSVDAKLSTLELTNGLVPIILDEQPVETSAPLADHVLGNTSEEVFQQFLAIAKAEDPTPESQEVEEEDPTETTPEEVEKFTQEQLEDMPAAVVKRMAKDLGLDPKTKAEAINYLVGCNTNVVNTPQLTVVKDSPEEVVDVHAEDLYVALNYSFLHFYHMDHANAAIHTSPVRFSPITFKLASLASFYSPSHDTPELREVNAHEGAYPLDMGR